MNIIIKNKKKVISISILLLFLIHPNLRSQGFLTTSINWSLPQGGKNLGGHNYGFNALNDVGSYDNANQGWSSIDMNGDGKPDLVITSQGNGTYKDSFNPGANPFWMVYLNTGVSYSNTAINWLLPPNAGKFLSGHDYGFNSLSDIGSPSQFDQGWTTMDINGDGKPDLIIICEGTGIYRDCFAPGANPYWKVHLNTGSGFSPTAINWVLPPFTGQFLSGHEYGLNAIAGSGSPAQFDQGWSTMDVNGDSKPDIVVVCEGTGVYRDCFAPGANPYWKVYLNTGSGFATTATNWTLPSYAGNYLSGHDYGFNAISYGGTANISDQGWSLVDMDGDKKPEMVLVCEGTGTYKDCFSPNSNSYWKVYQNNGSGFSNTAINWSLPTGGQFLSGHNYGYNSIAYNGTYDINNQGWIISDIDGDGKTDFVITSQGTGTYRDCFNPGPGQYWKVHLNAGTGFQTNFINWSLPAGGMLLSGHNFGFNVFSEQGTFDSGNQGWSPMDMDGDGKLDLVVVCQGTGSYKDCFNPGPSQYWKVYLSGSTVGLNEKNNFDSQINLYPNPTKHLVNINGDEKIVGQEYAVLDMTGKLLMNGKINMKNQVIDISDFSVGIYIVKIGNSTKKIIKE
ncbi:MAG: T9SS type A sorting domain-containing protein [Sphingobacteriaceae bacterium]|nr:T9SS type A sorting domain-containing protein [Sphingobacteriaceae bacterium]